jgi:radical SAM superfamily enzyme YgiQ (UPF0313 family)
MTNIYINSIYADTFIINVDPNYLATTRKRFPFFYFWSKDHYFQRSPGNFQKTKWFYSDHAIPIRDNQQEQSRIKENMPDIVGLGVYMWNIDTVMENAKWIKEQNPNAIVVAGGPSAEANPAFFKKYDFIDLVILGPSTEIFRRIVDAVVENKSIYNINGVSFIKDSRVYKNKPLPRTEDPLLINFVENFREEVEKVMSEYLEKYSGVIFQTYVAQGCPYSCSFCEQGTAFWSKLTTRPLENIFKEIDFLVNYKNIEYEFVDANFGITNDYIKVIDYINKKNTKNNLYLKYPAMAKNNIDNVFEIIEKMIQGNLIKSGMYSHIALQDTNPEVLKLNGRPMSKEFQKIERFKQFTKSQKYRLNKTDLIIGLPGQSFESLSVTLYDLFINNLLGHYPPNYYTVLPNTTLTSEHNEIYFESTVTNLRSFKAHQVIDFDGIDYSKLKYKIRYLTKSDTINAAEIVAADYMFILLSHAHGFIRWLDTPLNYLKNYHNKTEKDFIKSYIKFFNPINWHLLPDSIKKDLYYMERWFTAKDEFFMRRDELDVGYLNPKTIPTYRFYASYHDMSNFFKMVFVDVIGQDHELLDKILEWQDYNTLYLNKKTTQCVSYNYDDIAQKKSSTYYLSNFVFEFDQINTETIYKKMRNLEEIHYIPQIQVFEVGQSMQKPLHVDS